MRFDVLKAVAGMCLYRYHVLNCPLSAVYLKYRAFRKLSPTSSSCVTVLGESYLAGSVKGADPDQRSDRGQILLLDQLNRIPSSLHPMTETDPVSETSCILHISQRVSNS
jgi:hypothetical protein